MKTRLRFLQGAGLVLTGPLARAQLIFLQNGFPSAGYSATPLFEFPLSTFFNFKPINPMNSISQITRKTATVLALVSLSWALACKGPQGDVGPAGEKGNPGVQGLVGPQGPAGTGTGTGGASVIYSGWVNMNVASYWTRSGNLWTASFACPQATPAFLEKGIALVYCRWAGQVRLLPFVYSSTLTVQAYFGTNARVTLERYHATNTPTTFTSNDIDEFRYVLIPGGVAGRQAAVDYSDYAAVKKAYNLPD